MKNAMSNGDVPIGATMGTNASSSALLLLQREGVSSPWQARMHALTTSPWLRWVRRLDIFPKEHVDYAQHENPHSAHGTSRDRYGEAIVTSIILSILLFLLLWEVLWSVVFTFGGATSDRWVQNMLHIDSSVQRWIPVHVNITFPMISCNHVDLDVIDIVGKQQNHIQTDLYKSPVDSTGKLVYVGYFQYVQHANQAYNARLDPSSAEFCGKCYIEPRVHSHGFDRKGGIVEQHVNLFHATECCNTCESVMAMYDRHRLPRPHIQEVEQCLQELVASNPGCNLAGTVWVHRVRGNMHFLPGKSREEGFSHVHQIDLMEMLTFNVTHTIHEFMFGEDTPSTATYVPSPLRGAHHRTRSHFELVQYSINIVPIQRKQTQPNVPVEHRLFTYSATKYQMEDGKEKASNMEVLSLPGLIFQYDFTPIAIEPQWSHVDGWHVVSQVCCLIGGLYIAHALSHLLFFS